MRKVVIECSKDRKKWIRLTEFIIPDYGFFIPSPKFQGEIIPRLIKQGYKYWRKEEIDCFSFRGNPQHH